MSSLNNFIQDLAVNPQLLHAYRHNPRQAMLESGLGEAEVQAILAGDKKQVERLTGNKESKTAFFHSNIAPSASKTEDGLKQSANLH